MFRNRFAVVLGILLVALVPVAFAQTDSSDDGFGSTLGDIGQDAAKGYLGPIATFLGTSMNSGWYNSSKSLGMFGLPVGISVGSISEGFLNVDDNMRFFTFSGNIPLAAIVDPMLPAGQKMADLKALPGNDSLQLAVPFSIDSVPTVFGPDSGRQVTIGELFASANDTTRNRLLKSPGFGIAAPLDSNDVVELPFAGIDFKGLMPTIPNATMFTLGVKKIPVVDNIQLGLRFLPEIELGDFGKVSQFGVKVQHELTHLLPIASSLPFFHTSAYWAMNNLTIAAGPATLKQSNWIAMVNASVDAKLPVVSAGAFIGVGIESSNLALDVAMDSTSGLPNFSMDIPGDNKFRFQVGPRFALGIFDIWADANFGSVTSYNAGITLIGLNGL